jgi:DNA-binding IclR family transcriptional regulator
VEDYLERILELINMKGYARVVDIAQRLQISKAGVTSMVQRLDAEGLLKYEKFRGLVLTTAGEALVFLNSLASTTRSSITMSKAWNTTSARPLSGLSKH